MDAGAPVPIQVFWLSSVVLDAVVVVLVVRERVAGMAAAALVMALDLATNWYCLWPDVRADPGRFLRPYGLLIITVFGVFVLVTSVPLSRNASSARDNRPQERNNKTEKVLAC